MIFLKLSDQTATHNETSDTVVTQQPSIDMKLIPGIMMDNLAKTNCFTNHLRKLTDVVQARQDNPKPTHTHTHTIL